MNIRLFKSALAGALPIVFVTLAAHARHIEAYLGVNGVPQGALVRTCSTHSEVLSDAFATDNTGKRVNNSCEASGIDIGTTNSTTGGADACDSSSMPSDPRHGSLLVIQQDNVGDTVLCTGTSAQGQPFSEHWTTTSLNPPSGVTWCTLPAAQGPRIQFSTDHVHYGNCFTADITAASLGSDP